MSRSKWLAGNVQQNRSDFTWSCDFICNIRSKGLYHTLEWGGQYPKPKRLLIDCIWYMYMCIWCVNMSKLNMFFTFIRFVIQYRIIPDLMLSFQGDPVYAVIGCQPQKSKVKAVQIFTSFHKRNDSWNCLWLVSLSTFPIVCVKIPVMGKLGQIRISDYWKWRRKLVWAWQ